MEVSQGASRVPWDVARSRRPVPRRRLVRFGLAAAGLLSLAGRARAHGGVGIGGPPVSFLVVLALPVVTGLLGAGAVLRHRSVASGRPDATAHRHHRSDVLSVLLVVLGATIVWSGLARSPAVTVATGTAGVVSATWLVRRELATGSHRFAHVHLTLGAVCVHRVLEGALLAWLSSSGVVVGLVGGTVLAAHAALESAAIAGVYATSRATACGAVVAVQLAFLAGAATGVSVAATFPASVRIGALAGAGGFVLGTGVASSLYTHTGTGRRFLYT